MTDPFDDENGRFGVLRDCEGRYSLWRHNCPRYAERHRTGLRPAGAGAGESA